MRSFNYLAFVIGTVLIINKCSALPSLLLKSKEVSTLAVDDQPWKLPKTSKPISYDLHLKSDIHTGSLAFNGNVRIKIEILEPTFELSLHNDGLNVTDVKVIDKSGSELKNTYKMDGYFKINIEDTILMQGTEYTLDITFEGLLRTGTSGFYRTYYQVNSNTTRY